MTAKEFLKKYGIDKFRLGARGLKNNLAFAKILANEVSESGFGGSYWFGENEIRAAFAQYILYGRRPDEYPDSDDDLFDISKAMKVYDEVDYADCDKKCLHFGPDYLEFNWTEFEREPDLAISWGEIYDEFLDDELKMIQDPDTDDDTVRLLVECK